MLLNDSVELEYYDYSASAEPLPLNLDIDLSKIWIPSNLLPNRKKALNPNENKPFVFYTLEKPDESKSFSVYDDESHEAQILAGVSSEISHKLINHGIVNHQIQQVPSLSGNSIEWNDRLNTSSKKDISLLDSVNSNNQDYSFKDSQAAHNTITKNVLSWGGKKSDGCPTQNDSNQVSFENLTRMAEILSENEPFKADWHHEDVIKGNQVTTGSTLDSIPPSTQDSLEELYYSDEEDNHFDIEEYNLPNPECESTKKKHTYSIYTENSYAQEQPSEKFVSNFIVEEQTKNNNDKIINKSFERAEKIPVESEKVAVDNASSITEYDELNNKIALHSKDSRPELLKYEKELESPTEKVVEFPIAYKRPPLTEHVNKTKSHKEKKKSKKSKINIPLEDLFQKEEGDRFQVPEVDEFYENLVRQGKCQPRNQDTNIEEFPFANFQEQLQTNSYKLPSVNSSEVPQTTLFWDSENNFIQSLDVVPHSSSPQEIITEEKPKSELKSEVSLDTLVIDNIPLNVSKENIESFILGYGKLRNLTIECVGNFQRATLQMDFNCEVDWIIDCLNDSQPFGSCNSELVKCYRQT